MNREQYEEAISRIDEWFADKEKGQVSAFDVAGLSPRFTSQEEVAEFFMLAGAKYWACYEATGDAPDPGGWSNVPLNFTRTCPTLFLCLADSQSSPTTPESPVPPED